MVTLGLTVLTLMGPWVRDCTDMATSWMHRSHTDTLLRPTPLVAVDLERWAYLCERLVGLGGGGAEAGDGVEAVVVGVAGVQHIGRVAGTAQARTTLGPATRQDRTA